MRAERGCDEPTERVQFEIDCPSCRGEDAKCPDCEGYGKQQFHRCMHSMFGQQHLDIVRSVPFLECGVLPCAGGWTDQSATWVDAVGIVRSEIDAYRRKAAKE